MRLHSLLLHWFAVWKTQKEHTDVLLYGIYSRNMESTEESSRHNVLPATDDVHCQGQMSEN